MKPFDLQKALEGHSLVTRDGRKATLVTYNEEQPYPLYVNVKTHRGYTLPFYYDKNGICNLSHVRDYDLFLKEDKLGYINIYQYLNHGEVCYISSSTVYPTKEKALSNKDNDIFKYLKTIEITL